MKAKLKPIRSEQAFRKYLKGLCADTTHTEVAKAHGISVSYLSNLINGYGCIGAKTASRFGYDRVNSVTFVPKKERPCRAGKN